MGVRYIFGQDGAFRTEPVIVAKNITENGTYDPATEGADGYAPVVVNVEGGGGSSDFSTAEVTIIAGDGGIVGFLDFLPILESDGLRTSIELSLEAQEQITKTVVLYKGKTIVGSFGFYTVESVSGNIAVDDDFYVITGDCSITLVPQD